MIAIAFSAITPAQEVAGPPDRVWPADRDCFVRTRGGRNGHTDKHFRMLGDAVDYAKQKARECGAMGSNKANVSPILYVQGLAYYMAFVPVGNGLCRVHSLDKPLGRARAAHAAA